MARVSSQKPSFQHLSDASVQRRTSPSKSVASVLRHWVYDPTADPHIKLLFRAFRLERPVQRRIMPKWDLHLVLFIETAICIRVQYSRGILWWCHSLKMGDHENCVPVSIGFSEMALLHSCFECQLVVSLLPEPGFLVKNQLLSQAREWISVLGIAHLNPSEAERMLCPVRRLKLYLRDSERI